MAEVLNRVCENIGEAGSLDFPCHTCLSHPTLKEASYRVFRD